MCAKQALRIKICGITRLEDALEAARLAVDALGFVFYPPSPRAVTATQAREIIAALPPFITTVGLFVNAAESEVSETIKATGLDLLQFHGEESADYCAAFERPYIKALRMRPDIDLHQSAADYATARGLLLDAYVKGVKGGTGESFDWTRVPRDISKPLILAGGLEPANAAAAIASARPYGVDVSGGVESAKGVKDKAKMADFVQRCRAC